jgi:hypothetical protein
MTGSTLENFQIHHPEHFHKATPPAAVQLQQLRADQTTRVQTYAHVDVLTNR